MLKPNGKLLVANFTHETKDIGFMEVFMNWYLIYRTRGDMEQIAGVLPKNEVAEIQIYPELLNENNRVIYLQITKIT